MSLDRTLFTLPDWYKALTLSERAASLRSSPPGAAGGDPSLAERRLERWRGQEPFASDGFFGRRLALDGLSERELRALLAETPVELAARAGDAPPRWLTALEEAFTRPAPERFPDSVAPPIPSSGFLNAVRPLLDTAYSRLLAGLRDLETRCPGLPFESTTAGLLLAANLPAALLHLLSRTLVLELQLARQQGQLAGETPEERFRSFVERLRDPAVAAGILGQYPVLARALVTLLDRWVAVRLELMERLAADWESLRALFSPGADPGALVEVKTGLGDPHRGNRSVTLFRFESGLRLIYKPKSLAVEKAFQELLDWTATRSFAPAFRTLRLLDRGEYGWIEFIEAAPCPDEEAVRRFYRRQGGYLALLWLLEATDFHWENLIAAGEHPVLVDLEALFQPRMGDLGKAPGEVDEARVGRVLQRTVLNTGLLPSRTWNDDGGGGVDLSGLAGTGGQAAPPVLRPEQGGTDEMRFSLQPIAIPAADNLPTLGDGPVTVAPYLDEVVAGFTRMAALFLEHREEMASPGGPLHAFSDAEVRIIVRPTRNYALLHFESLHPFTLGDALDRDRLFDRLWLAAPEAPFLERLIPAERRDLLRGDIPMFTTRAGSRDVWSADGERFTDLQPDTGLERVLRRLHGLDEAEIGRQSWIVHNSLATLDLRDRGRSDRGLRDAGAPSREELLAAAKAVGDRLEEIAIRGPRDAHWFSPTSAGSGGGGWVLQPARLDLHLGATGIALFLAWLGELTGESRYTGLARAAMVAVRELLPHGRQLFSNMGAFSGWGGMVWTLTHLGVLWGDEELLREAERIAHEEIPPLIAGDDIHDLIGGASGCLISLLTLHEVRPSDRLVASAIQCGESLVASAQAMERGLGWHLKIAGPIPLAGLSHGVAGIAWSLLRLAALTGDSRFRDTALGGLEYERSLYRPDERNWPDLRADSLRAGAGEPQSMWAWCHGAPGVGLGRLAALPYLDDATVRGEIEAAVESTIEKGFGTNHSLCHGDLGNLEVVTLAAERLRRPDWSETAGRLAGGILASIRERGWRFGLPGRTEPPGMMVGLAGIGYGLLRLADPERVPSVLILEGPRTRTSSHGGNGSRVLHER
ncbi:MAG TPA: type 2 lanthipeptide synthetase LanM family protein [Thermoanaerobaculia bacterium]|nr:type 2 lanthipeptide synthetase LanM family protein [Thermoanaerobaculia bacterium]